MSNFVIATINSDDQYSEFVIEYKKKLETLLGPGKGLVIALDEGAKLTTYEIDLGDDKKFIAVSINSDFISADDSAIKKLEKGLSDALSAPVGVFVLNKNEKISFSTINKE